MSGSEETEAGIISKKKRFFGFYPEILRGMFINMSNESWAVKKFKRAKIFFISTTIETFLLCL